MSLSGLILIAFALTADPCDHARRPHLYFAKHVAKGRIRMSPRVRNTLPVIIEFRLAEERWANDHWIEVRDDILAPEGDHAPIRWHRLASRGQWSPTFSITTQSCKACAVGDDVFRFALIYAFRVRPTLPWSKCRLHSEIFRDLR